jgi:hypothetical protein
MADFDDQVHTDGLKEPAPSRRGFSWPLHVPEAIGCATKMRGKSPPRLRVPLVSIFDSAQIERTGARALMKFRRWNSAARGSLGAENVDTVGMRSLVLFRGDSEGGRR